MVETCRRSCESVVVKRVDVAEQLVLTTGAGGKRAVGAADGAAQTVSFPSTSIAVARAVGTWLGVAGNWPET